MTDRLDDYQSHREYRSHTAKPAWRAIAVIIVTMFAAMKISASVRLDGQPQEDDGGER